MLNLDSEGLWFISLLMGYNFTMVRRTYRKQDFLNHGTNVGLGFIPSGRRLQNHWANESPSWYLVLTSRLLMKPWVEGVSRFLGRMMVGRDVFGSCCLHLFKNNPLKKFFLVFFFFFFAPPPPPPLHAEPIICYGKKFQVSWQIQ
jgi:hypothetical protein